MTGAGFRISVDGQEAAERQLAALAARFGDLTPLMDVIGGVIEADVHDNFMGEHSPEGVKWTPSQRVIAHGGKTLQLSRRLLLSIARRVGRDFVEVGSNLPYAARHQNGFNGTEQVRSHRRRITQAFGRALAEPIEVVVGAFSRKANTPARPYLGWSAAAREEVAEQVAAYAGAQP
ncbi:phage virion morphogenesis protein [Sphingomonas canadensis]|uniref:Phage virion morphogenesis protein n=1 Tax=Sphingomonas canadensis TaxID=1219257 RepID=A0ABW3H4F7_9SPHN|nr:phage virion morphogenesis protein [Sphingomonas canadensis]MCW3835973.1 phage virion morphogenesis protein [Sphingomonas canadensis]